MAKKASKAKKKGIDGEPKTPNVEEDEEYQKVISTYYEDEETVRALIALKVDTKMADSIAVEVSKSPSVIDTYMVTGDVDIILRSRFKTYNDLRNFIVNDLGNIKGIKETRTMMIVTTYKENGEET